MVNRREFRLQPNSKTRCCCTNFSPVRITVLVEPQITASVEQDEPHLGRLLWLRAGGYRPRGCDARSGDELVGLRSVAADHGRGGWDVYRLARSRTVAGGNAIATNGLLFEEVMSVDYAGHNAVIPAIDLQNGRACGCCKGGSRT